MPTVTDAQAGCEPDREVCGPASEVCEAHDCTSPEPRADGGGQPCPPPLMWQQVVAAVHEQSSPWEIERAGRRIAGRTFGEGRPLYFLNGIGGTHDLFSLAIWLLRDSFRCVLFDYAPPVAGAAHGAGHTSLPAQLDSLAGDLFAVADHPGDRRFSVYATSFGSAVALTAMVREPARIERSVLQGGFARIRLSHAERLAIRVGAWCPGRVRNLPLRRLVQQQSHRPWFPPFDQTRWEFFSDNTGNLPIAVLAERGGALRSCDLRPLLPEIRTPVLLIRSEGEGRVSAAAHGELESRLPNVRSEYLAGSGHLPYLTHPHRLVKLIAPFLTDEPARAPVSPAPHDR